MTVTQELMKPGSWDLRLAGNTPAHVRRALVEKGYIVIVPRPIDPRGIADADILAQARYHGVVDRVSQGADEVALSGSGLAGLLQTASGHGVVIDPTSFTAGTLSDWLGAILPANDLTAGTITNTGTNLTAGLDLITARAAIDYACAGCAAEWRVNPNRTIDAAAPGTLFAQYTTPNDIVLRRDGGADGNITGLTVEQLSFEVDASEWTSQVVLVGEGEGESVTVDFANIGANPYLAPGGSALTMQRLVDSPATPEVSAATLAAQALAQFDDVNRTIELSTDTYDVGRFLQPGDSIWVWDRDLGLTDPANRANYRGRTLDPMTLRVFALTWPVPDKMAVLYRTGAGVYTDLTPYYVRETGPTVHQVGAPRRAISSELVLPTSMTGPKTNHAILERRSRMPGMAANLYTPTWTRGGGTPPAIGNGSIGGRYERIGAYWNVEIALTIGSTTTFGSGGDGIWRLSMPSGFTAISWTDQSFAATLVDIGVTSYPGVAHVGAGLTTVFVLGSSGFVSSATPFTWATSDALRISIRFAEGV